MEEGRPSMTAQLVAGLRAGHHESGERPLVFEDPFAAAFTGSLFLEPLERGGLQAMLDGLGLQPIQGGILGRARYAEDALEAALREVGVRQLVILGAGNDSFLLRRPDLLERLEVFELDHPSSQAAKRETLRRLGFAGHPHAHFVGVDFERESAGLALLRGGFERSLPAFFNWLGVVTYLSRDALFSTLRSLREVAAEESRVVFDYPIAPHLLRLEDRARAEEVSRSTALFGEPRTAKHVPEELFREVCSLGYQVIEDLSPARHFERYFAGRRDGLRPNPEVHLLQLRMRA